MSTIGIDCYNHNLPLGTVGKCKIAEKAWGREWWIINSLLYCAKILRVEPNHQLSTHFHKDKDESWLLLEGDLTVILVHKDSTIQSLEMAPGDVLHIPPGLVHSFSTKSENTTIVEISTPHSDEDSYRIRPSR